MHLHVFAQRARMRICLIATFDATRVRLVGRVHEHMLLPVGTVSEAAIAAGVLAFEGLFT